MKKFILFASVFAGLFAAASCQQEKLEPEMNGSVTYEISLPTAPQTKGDNGYSSYDLHYEVYKTADASALETASLLFEKTVQMTGNTTKVTLDLLNDQDYTILFWANKQGTEYFDLTNLRNVVVKAPITANNDDRDAFCGKDQIIQHDGAQTKTVTLTRPFAQVNIGTIVPSQNQIGYDVTPSKSYVKISDIPTAFNVFTGLPEGQATAIEFSTEDNPADIPSGNLKVNDDESSYKWVAMNYIVVPESVVEVYYEITTANGVVKNTINNVPVKKNYRTNIIGNLLTSNATYNIVILPGFEGDNGAHVEVINEGVIKNINGDYEITNEKGLAYAINNLFVDANGVANTATFYVKPGIYDMAQHAIKDITVTSGTLKVYDSEPVVTRSVVIGGVVIEGLTKALINTVEEGATVFFSGITVTDFNGTDDAAALVQNNEGKVVLAGCQILDENGAPDQDTKLVGGKAPVEVVKGEEEAGELIYTAEQLAAAFADETVESIALGADIALENTLVFPEGRIATLDLRGWVLTVAEPEATYVLNNYGTLKIKDSYTTGAVKARGIYNGYVAEGEPVSTAKLTIESGTFNAMGTNGGAAVYNYGQVEVKGGAFTSIGGYSLNNQSGASMSVAEGVKINNGIYNNGAALTINGGEIEGNRSGCHVVYSYNSTVTINGGTIHNNNSGNSTLMAAGTSEMTVNGGTFSIKDGRVEGNSNTWTSCLTDTQNSAVLTVNGGTFNGGFRVQAGTTMNINGGSFNDCFGSNYNIYGTVNVKGGTYTDVTALNFAKNFAHKDYKLVGETIVPKVYVVEAGEDKYESIQEAVDAVEDGATIKLINDLSISETSDPNGNAVYYTGDKSLVFDLNGKTLTGNTSNAVFRFQKAEGEENTITIQNGTVEALENTWSAISIGSSSSSKTIVNLVDLTIKSQKANDMAVRARTGSSFTLTNCNVTAINGAGAIVAGGGDVTITETIVSQTGVYNWNSVALGVSSGAKMIVNSGVFTSDPDGNEKGTWVAYVMSSGGTLEINGGTFNGTVAETANASNACGLICADRAAVVNIKGGTFNSNGAILDMRNNVGTQPNPVANLSGGTFSADPRVSGLYSSNLILVADGCVVKETENGRFTIGRPVAKVGNTEYGSIDEAIAAWTNNATLTLLSDVTLSDVVTLKSTEHHILNLATYTMTAASGKNAIEITCNGRSSASYALTVNADATNPGGITATGNACIYYKKSDSTKDRPIILINNGVFTGSYSINSISNGNTNCPQVWINGGVFNSYMNLTKNLLQVKGGTFHAAINCTGDQNAYRLIAGGRFKSWQFMTADAPNKFAVSSTMSKDSSGNWIGTYDIGVYVDDEGYLVVGGPVITEFGDKFAAKATNATKWSSYLKYSSAAEHGLYYTNADAAIKKHGADYVTLK